MLIVLLHFFQSWIWLRGKFARDIGRRSCPTIFQEFDTREAAEESVAKYHEGYFMGNKIRVELSHGGGRTAKYSGDPGACFKCGQMGHWARSVKLRFSAAVAYSKSLFIENVLTIPADRKLTYFCCPL
jgi:Zinc knuckle